MNIVIFCKRRPMGKDLFEKPYGRFYYLAYYLAKMGHQVQLVLFSYRPGENTGFIKENLSVRSISLFPNPFYALNMVNKLIRKTEPEWVVGFSDTYYGIMAVHFARSFKKKSLVDAYDNFEAYMNFAKPLHWVWRNAIRKADLVTCTGPGLVDLFKKYGRKEQIEIIPMTTDPAGFLPMPKQQSRKVLELPVDKKLVGYHGSIHHSRDITVLFDAIGKLRIRNKDIVLVLSGRHFRNVKIPDDAIFLGYLPDEKIPYFINSMDVIAVPNCRSVFGEHSYPIKIYEAMACNIPVVATQTRATEWIMKKYPDMLVPPNNSEKFANVIEKLMNKDRVDYYKLLSWEELSKKLDSTLNNYF